MKKILLASVIGMLISSLTFGAGTEVRKVTQPDIEWGPSTDNVTSAGGHVGGKIPRYYDNNAFSDNLTLYGNDLIAKGPWVDVRAHGAVAAGGDISTAFNDTMNAISDNTTVVIPPGYYTASVPLVKNTSRKNIRISAYGAVIRVTHNGDGLVLISTGSNPTTILEGITLIGPNAQFDNTARPSTGKGIDASSTFFNVYKDLDISGFYYGYYQAGGYSNKVEGKNNIWNNQVGMYLSGEGLNFSTNYFSGVSVRMNYLVGLKMVGGSNGVYGNVFNGMYVESNKPYPYRESNAPTEGVGVYLDSVYDTIFNNVYSEDHKYSIYLTSNSANVTFNDWKITGYVLNGNSRGRIVLDGAGYVRNVNFNRINYLGATTAERVLINTSSVESINFRDCQGFYYPVNVAVNISNGGISTALEGETFDTLRIPDRGIWYTSWCDNSTTPNCIKGQGTDNATINVYGRSELYIPSATEDGVTTLVNVASAANGQYFTISNSQSSAFVKIKSTPASASKFSLKGNNDIAFTGVGQMVMFYYGSAGYAVQLAENFQNVDNTTHANFVGQTYTSPNFLTASPVVYTASDAVRDMTADFSVTVAGQTALNIVTVSDNTYFRVNDVISFPSPLGSILTPHVVTSITGNNLTFTPAMAGGDVAEVGGSVYLSRWF